MRQKEKAGARQETNYNKPMAPQPDTVDLVTTSEPIKILHSYLASCQRAGRYIGSVRANQLEPACGIP